MTFSFWTHTYSFTHPPITSLAHMLDVRLPESGAPGRTGAAPGRVAARAGGTERGQGTCCRMQALRVFTHQSGYFKSLTISTLLIYCRVEYYQRQSYFVSLKCGKYFLNVCCLRPIFVCVRPLASTAAAKAAKAERPAVERRRLQGQRFIRCECDRGCGHTRGKGCSRWPAETHPGIFHFDFVSVTRSANRPFRPIMCRQVLSDKSIA